MNYMPATCGSSTSSSASMYIDQVSQLESFFIKNNAPTQLFDLSAMPDVEKLILKKKLKTELAHVRFAVENVLANCERRLAQKYSTVEEYQAKTLGQDCTDETVASTSSFCNSDQQTTLIGEKLQGMLGKKRRLPEINIKFANASHEIATFPEKSDARSVVTGASKEITVGGSDCQKGAIEKMDSDCQKGAIEKMDSNKTRQCANTLKMLMNHPAGWVFNQPVDPVKLMIPDYFSIISKPMDLGTIKHKLGSKQYLSTVQFAADVRLTFSNALRYNPPGNQVHIMANELNNIFNSKWKSLEAKWKNESTATSPQSVTNSKKKLVLQKKLNSNSILRKSLTPSDKRQLKKELSKLPIRKIPPSLLLFLRRKCMLGQVGDFLNVDIDMFDEETICELHQIVKSCFGATKIEIKKSSRQLKHESVKGKSDIGPQSGLVDMTISCLASMKSAHRTAGCMSSPCNDFSQASTSELDFERPPVRRHHSLHSTAHDGVHIRDLERTSTGVGLGSKYAIQSIPRPSSSSAHVTEEIVFPCEEQLSPTKALRAAMLRTRFADTILKAQHQSLGENVDPAKLQREREKLEKRQQEEKARIEAQVKAAENAARMKAEAELKLQREREREAARLALQKMEKTVEIDNSHVLKDLENLGCPPTCLLDTSDDTPGNIVHEFELQSGLMNPLEQLGLFMKKDDLDEVDEGMAAVGNGEVEEGEINYL